MTTRQASAPDRAASKTLPASAAPTVKKVAKPRTAKAPDQETAKIAAKAASKPRATPAPATKAGKTAVTPSARSRSMARTANIAPPGTTAGPVVDRQNDAISAFSLSNVSYDTRIARNFLVHELTHSDLADRRGIANPFPSDNELRAAIHLAREVLQPIRDKFGSFTPNSVFRGQALERALKNKPATWLSTSQHARGEACDIEIVGMTTLALANWAKENLKDFDQIICECYDPAKGPNSGWVHISLKVPGTSQNRRQLLSYVMDHGKMVYVPGLIPDAA
jgi:hypothetical protein